MIEFVVGSESHISRWGKFDTEGLERWETKRSHKFNRQDNNHLYQFITADVPIGTMFSVLEQNGDKRGPVEWIFFICVVVSDGRHEIDAGYGNGFCHGNYRVVAEASGKKKAPRLMDWWGKRPKGARNTTLLAYAQYCDEHIEKSEAKPPKFVEAL